MGNSNGYLSRSALDELDKKKEKKTTAPIIDNWQRLNASQLERQKADAETKHEQGTASQAKHGTLSAIEVIQKNLSDARAEFITEKHNAQKKTQKPKGDNSAYRAAQSKVTAARNKVNRLEKELEAATGVSSRDRLDLTLGGAMKGMGASYAGAGGTLLKGTDMAGRMATDTDILAKRGEIAGQKYAARRHVSKPKGDNSVYRAERADTRQLQRELEQLVAVKEAEALAAKNKTGLLKAASALDGIYEELAKKSANDIARAKLGTSDVEQFLIDTTVAGAQLASDTVANALLPGSGIALKGVRSFGDASQEARQNGANVGRQLVYGGLTAGKDVVIEKTFDGLASAYGPGILDGLKHPQLKEAAEAGVSTLTQPLLESIYNHKKPVENYDMDVLTDALRNAAIKGIVSSAGSAFDDAKNAAAANAADAINRASEASSIQQQQASIRKGYVGSAQQNAEGYASLIRALLQAKGDGRRW